MVEETPQPAKPAASQPETPGQTLLDLTVGSTLITNRRFRLRLVIALLLLAIAAFAGVWFTSGHGYRAIGGNSGDIAQTGGSESFRPHLQSGGCAQRVGNGPKPNGPGVASMPEVDSNGGAILIINFRDQADTPAGGVGFSIQEPGKSALFAVSDGSGSFQLRTTVGSTVQVQACGEPKKVPVGSRGTEFMLRPNYSAPWCSRQYDFAIKEPRRTVVVRVFAAKDVSIQASYEDGVAYVGSLSVSFKRILRDIHHGSAEGAIVPGVPLRDGVTLALVSHRAGFASLSNYPLSLIELERGALITVRIPRETRNPLGSIEVSFAGFLDEIVDVALFSRGDRNRLVSTSSAHRSSSNWSSEPIAPGTYDLFIAGKFAAHIPDVTVEPSKVTLVTARAQLSASLRARVLDPTGKPLAAAMEIHRDELPFLAPLAGVRAVADSGGNVELSGVPAGRFVFSCEAMGYSPRTFEISLQPSSVNELGDVYLERARGVCLVKINGMKPSEKYSVVIMQSGRAAGYPFRPVKDNPMRIDGLVIGRHYQVGVTFAGGGEVFSVPVVLQVPDDPTSIEIDVTELLRGNLDFDD